MIARTTYAIGEPVIYILDRRKIYYVIATKQCSVPAGNIFPSGYDYIISTTKNGSKINIPVKTQHLISVTEVEE